MKNQTALKNATIASIAFAVTSLIGATIITQEAAARCYGPAMPEAPACQLVKAPHLN